MSIPEFASQFSQTFQKRRVLAEDLCIATGIPVLVMTLRKNSILLQDLSWLTDYTLRYRRTGTSFRYL